MTLWEVYCCCKILLELIFLKRDHDPATFHLIQELVGRDVSLLIDSTAFFYRSITHHLQNDGGGPRGGPHHGRHFGGGVVMVHHLEAIYALIAVCGLVMRFHAHDGHVFAVPCEFIEEDVRGHVAR